MDRIIRFVIAILAISLSSVSIAGTPRQSFIVYEDFNYEELKRVKTIALLEVPDPA